VGVDRSRKQSRSRQVDSFCAWRNSRVVTGTGVSNGISRYDYNPVVMGSRVYAIEDCRRLAGSLE
jgi:hypothetical protein